MTNVTQAADGTDVTQTNIESVVDDSSNVNYAHRNIITRDSIINTGVDRARVTSHPGQDGQVDTVVVGDG